MKSTDVSETERQRAQQRSRALYGAAQDAMRCGDNVEAYALLQELLPLLAPAGELQSEHVVLGQMGRLLAEAKSYAPAVELWCRAIRLAEAQGDLQGASLLLDRVAALHAAQGAWRRALEFWERALELDTRLGHAHNRAATLANVAGAAAQLGDKLKADRCWSEALGVFEAVNQSAQALALGKAIHSVALTSNDWSDPLGLRARVLRVAEAAGDVLGQVMALDGLAHAAVQLRKYAEALPHWQRACAVATELGDAAVTAQLEENVARCQADLRGEKARPSLLNTRWYYPSISEYAVPADAGVAFVGGELWAALHARGMPLRGLKAGDVRINPAGIARLSPGVRLRAGAPFEPESAAVDLEAALEGYSQEQAAGVLAGYSRRGYELLDRSQPGFTDALLDHFGVPRPRLGEMRAVDAEELLGALGVGIRANQGQLSLVVLEATGQAPLWQNAPERAFLFVLALLVVGVDCRELWERDAGVAWPAFELLLPRPKDAAAPDADLERRMALVPPGLELAAALALSLRGLPHAEPFEFTHVMPWAREVLTKGPDAQAVELGDILTDVALFCAELLRPQGGPAQAALLQKAIIFLEYTARGQPSDEVRLLVITRALHGLPQVYPSPLEPWPTQHGPWLWQWNSLLLTLRELATKAVAAQERGQLGVLRSAALRGVGAARHVLRVSYASAHSRDPEVAASGLLVLRATIKNYGFLLHAFAESVRLEHEATGKCGWLPWLDSVAGPPHLARELEWSGWLLQAAAGEGFSLDVARSLMRGGTEFCAEENCYFALPSALSLGLASN